MFRLLLTFQIFLAVFVSASDPVSLPEISKDREADGKEGTSYQPSIGSRSDLRTFLVKVPAPRGLIVDRTGEPLATNRSVKRLAVSLVSLDGAENGEQAFESLLQLSHELAEVVGNVEVPVKSKVLSHWKNRKFLPFPVSGALEGDAAREADLFIEGYGVPLLWQHYFVREYSTEPSISHLVGYVGKSMPDQHGPFSRKEYWTITDEGRTGLEKMMDHVLVGTPGTMSLLYDADGKEINREMYIPPIPGRTVVTTLSLKMQQSAARRLEKTNRDGAFVALDADTGDVLALVSHPGFDANEFVPNISEDRYRQIADDPSGPLFNRAVTGVYPPGSTFKPIIALAGLQSHLISKHTQFSGPPAMDVDGRIFKNWNQNHEGVLDVKFALLRSCNTWFYQAAFRMGDRPIHEAMELFGVGHSPLIELDTVSPGNHPEIFSSRRGLANVSIGQGAILVSPLQMAKAMGVFATRGDTVRPRLILQTQDALRPAEVEPAKIDRVKLPYAPEHVDTVRDGMWGVVNYGGGTGQAASMSMPYVFGKTGTAQWTHGGQERRLAWFTGFVDAVNPRIAFAVLSEGRVGESMSGGGNAAPVIADVLKAAYRSPDEFSVSKPERHFTSAPSLNGGRAYGSFELIDDGTFHEPDRRSTGIFSIFERRRASSSRDSRSNSSPRRGNVFSRLFGR